ncbi:hypothetical protein NLG97_g8809 [Lecanicillium saksenae]|uniref:Uncharacterized protein n=1 Tax=Lecanicillium saksenae TaxID=468837 RepID=A0ACC1QI02_9HYPO|nr:hypothetical protein NLG97_g8809 [Lecanicillium saksenae]
MKATIPTIVFLYAGTAFARATADAKPTTTGKCTLDCLYEAAAKHQCGEKNIMKAYCDIVKTIDEEAAPCVKKCPDSEQLENYIEAMDRSVCEEVDRFL